jgi:MOSC domain-containing protein YiiM
MNWFIEEIRIGPVRPLGPTGVPSGIDKRPVAGAVRVTPDGLAGDGHGDTRHHGGPEKAVHLYPHDHYPAWRADLPGRADLFRAGAFGENAVVRGITEADVCVGDVFRAGTALLEISQGRQPCWRLNLRFELPDMARRVQASGRTGWYFRVLRSGEIAAGAALELAERPHPVWPLARVDDVLYRDVLNLDALAELAALPRLSTSWRQLAARRLERRSVEDWAARVSTPA